MVIHPELESGEIFKITLIYLVCVCARTHARRPENNLPELVSEDLTKAIGQ